jgi:hypothetical protein
MNAARALLLSTSLVLVGCSSGVIAEPPAPSDADSAGQSGMAIVGDPILLGVNPAAPMLDFPPAGSPTSLGMARLWDLRVTWGDVEPDAPKNGVHTYDFSRLDERMSQAGAVGMRPMIVLYGTPEWATKGCTKTYTGSCTTYPDDPEGWSAFVRAVAARYVLQSPVYEVWNEPNLDGKKGDLAYWTGTDAELLDLNRRAYEAVKQTANAPVVCCGWNRKGANDAQSAMDRWLALGGAAYADAISYHPYPYDWDPATAKDITALFRASMARHGVSKALWATEVGFVNKGSKDPRALSLAEQTGLVTQTILTLRAESVPVVLWYLWNESHEGYADSDYVGLHRVLGEAVVAAGSAPNKPKPANCDAGHPPPSWGVKGGQCLAQCGALGGTVASTTPCAKKGLVDVGEAYDVDYCCTTGAVGACDPVKQPAPAWGMKAGQCLASCDVVGGTSASTKPCAKVGKVDAGKAYDVDYCCFDPPSACDPATQPSPQWGPKGGQCLPGCGTIGGTSAFESPCAQHGKVDAGAAYDVAYCCKDEGVPPVCDPVTQPSPQWGVKNGQCLQACGLVGGTSAFVTPCDQNGKVDAGAAYDVAYCCKEPPPVCDPATQPSPQWGVKNGQCLGCCGCIGGTKAFDSPCGAHGMADAGAAYDVAYCCK